MLIAPLPAKMIPGSHFGPNLICFLVHQYHHQHVTQPLLREQLNQLGIHISTAQLSRIPTEGKDAIHHEKDQLLTAVLAVSPLSPCGCRLSAASRTQQLLHPDRQRPSYQLQEYREQKPAQFLRNPRSTAHRLRDQRVHGRLLEGAGAGRGRNQEALPRSTPIRGRKGLAGSHAGVRHHRRTARSNRQ